MSEENKSVIVTKNLSKWYGDVRGVSGIHLEIGSGIIGLVGPNAAGKTTLLHLIAGLLKPSQGSLSILGENAFTGTHFRRQLGFAPQKEALYPFMTVFEFVTTLTELHGFSQKEAREKALVAIEKVRLTHKREARLDTLSKGMKQCAKLAQAIAHDPKILLLDETLMGCDPLVKFYLKNLLKEMAGKGVTVILASHNLKEMELLTEQVIILDRGKVVAYGKVDELQKYMKSQQHKLLISGRGLRALARDLVSYDDVVDIEIAENSLVVNTVHSEEFYKRLPRLVCEGNYEVEKVVPINQNLEALFRFLIGGGSQ